MRGGRKEGLDLVVKIFRSSLLLCSALLCSALLCSPVCGWRLLICSRQVSSGEQRVLPPLCPPEVERERSHLSERTRGRTGGGQGKDRGLVEWADNGDKHHILFNTKQHHNIQSASSDLVHYILKYILYFQYEIIKYFPGSHSVFWQSGRQEREEREIPAGWRCLYISLLCRAALVPPERERIYLALLSLSSSLSSPHIHTVPCRCVYACSDLLCQGKKTQHLVLFLTCHVGHEWHNKPISPWLHQCCQDCKNPPTKYRNISVKRFIRKINLIVRFSKYFHSS